MNLSRRGFLAAAAAAVAGVTLGPVVPEMTAPVKFATRSPYSSCFVGKFITITGASGGNNGTFKITGVSEDGRELTLDDGSSLFPC